MTQEDFLRKVAENLFEEPHNVVLNTELKELEGWDSLGRLSIVVFLQEDFAVMVDSQKLLQCHLVKDLVELVKDKLEDHEMDFSARISMKGGGRS